MKIGNYYSTTTATLWKDGTYFPRGTRVMVTGMHLEQGYCIRFPAEIEGEPLETWEDWGETDFITDEKIHLSRRMPPKHIMREASEVLREAEDGCHLHLSEEE